MNSENENDYYNKLNNCSMNDKIGRNIVKCKGKLVCGITNHLPNMISLILLGVILLVVWGIFIFPLLIDYNFVVSCVLQFLVFYLTIYNLFKCFMTEPGIIPRNYKLYTKDEFFKSDDTKELLDSTNSESENIPRIYQERFCYTCNIIRPAKVSHCQYCDNCVIGFDQ
jgi:palmitoyltransferase ZDHHC9/14/18